MSKKILSIDYGTKKFGLALSDESQLIASRLPLMKVKNEEEALAKLVELIEQEEIEKIIIGIPYNFDGTHSPFSKRIEDFSQKLEKKFSDIIIEAVDESMTSSLARESSKTMRFKRKNIDGEAARIMLQEYLDSKNS